MSQLHTTHIEVELYPGTIRRVRLINQCLPQLVLARYVRQADGSMKLVAVGDAVSGTVKLTHGLPRKLGLDCSYFVFRRLIKAGFIQANVFARGVTLINVASLNDYLQATRTDSRTPFWTPEKRALYTQADGGLCGAD